MDAKAVEVAHNERRRRSLMIQRGSRFEIRGERNIDQRIVEMLQSPSGPVVLPSYAVTEEDQCRGDDQGDPASFGKFFHNADDENGETEDEPDQMDDNVTRPVRIFLPMENPVANHPRFGKR